MKYKGLVEFDGVFQPLTVEAEDAKIAARMVFDRFVNDFEIDSSFLHVSIVVRGSNESN